MRIKLNKKILYIISCLLALFIIAGVLLFIFSNSGTKIIRDSSRIGPIVQAKGIQVSDTLMPVAENDKLRFFFNGTDCTFAVEDKSAGTKWYSNPQESDASLKGISDTNKKLLKSQLVIRYMNNIDQEIKMDSATFCIDTKQYAAKKIQNGVLVTYSFAYPQSNETYPRALSMERYQEIFNSLKYSADKNLMKELYALIDRKQLKEDELAKMTDRYGALSSTNIYILRDGQLNAYNRKKLASLFESIGYTSEQMRADLNEVQYKGSSGSGESFTIPVQYVLEKDGLKASVNCQDIRYTESDSGFFPLISIELLDFFGCASQNETGYILIPDGSGALVDFKQRNNRNTTLEGYVYGKDKAILNTVDNTITENFAMPVFGIKTGTGSMLAVIEDGDAMARIRVNTGGDGIPFNRISAAFDTMNKDYIPIGETATRQNFYVYSNDIYKGNLSVKYYFASGAETSYETMAEIYRSNLMERGLLTKNLSANMPSIVLELQGAIDVVKTAAGIPYKSTTALTGFNEVKDITNELLSNGITNPVIHYSGIYNGGYKTALQDRFETDSSLGSSADLSDLLNFLTEKNITLFAGADFYHVSKTPITKSFHTKEDAVRNLTREIFKSGSSYLVTPSLFGKVTAGYTRSASKFSISGVAPADFGKLLYSDFNPTKQTLRQDSLNYISSALKDIKDSGINVLSDGANSYMFPFSDIVTSVPFEDSGYMISSGSVPFYQMVVHGYLDYSGKPVNYEGEPTDAVLQSVMTGSLLKYKLIAKPSYVLNDTDYSDLYAAGFDHWKNDLVKSYQKTNDFLTKVREKKLTGFEVLSDKVTLSTFENTAVIVNRTSNDYEYNGIIVKAKDFYCFDKGVTK